MIRIFTEQNAKASDPIGRKAANLLLLKNAGFSVPSWLVVAGIDITLTASDLEEVLTTIREIGLSEKHFAVRSSAELEDTDGSSFAGMYETVLNVPERDLPLAIQKVLESSQSSRAQEYLKLRNIEPQKRGISVLIQEMIPAEVSGVAFGMNPVSGNRNEKVVSSVYGLGEGLVSGKLDADHFTISGNVIEKELCQKRFGFFPSARSGVERKEIKSILQYQSSLSEVQLYELRDALNRLEKQTRVPQDIEFSIYQNKIWYLQTRPITTLEATKDEAIYWDNNNIIESYPGTTTPLTFSFVRKTYQIGYMQLCEMIGVSRAKLNQNLPLFENMIGLIQNRMYYNLNNIHSLIGLAPGSNTIRRHFENAIGIEEFKKKDQNQTGFILIPILRMIYQFLRLRWSRKRFVLELQKVLDEMSSSRLEKMNAEELFKLYRDLETRVFGFWRAPVVNGLCTMVFFGSLKSLTAKWGLAQAYPNILNDLMVGQKSIISTEPILKIFELTEQIRKTPNLFSLFSQNDVNKIWEELKKPEFKDLKLQIENYLDRYGERCIGGELKLENPSYRNQPTLFMEVLKSYLAQDIKLSFDQDKNSEIRMVAERRVKEHFKNQKLKAFLYQKLLTQTRQMVIWRENLRYNRTQAFGIVKAIFNEVGKRFETQGVLLHSKDVFFLTQEEIFNYRGYSRDELKNLVSARKTDFELNSKKTLSARIVSYGDLSKGKFTEVESIQSGSRSLLKGVGCSSGKVSGKVKIVKSPDELDHLKGDILVAESTDPGWVKLFPTASAILLERGSLLSHAGIVTREMGIPCVVGVKGLLSLLNDGDQVEMDGALGLVKILKNVERSEK